MRFYQPLPRASLIDRQVIDGHIIPNHVLFTTPTPSNKPYETLAFTDNLKVTISFSTEQSDKGNRGNMSEIIVYYVIDAESCHFTKTVIVRMY